MLNHSILTAQWCIGTPSTASKGICMRAQTMQMTHACAAAFAPRSVITDVCIGLCAQFDAFSVVTTI